MSYYSPSIEKLIEAFEKLPSIGNKTAARLAFYVLNSSQEETNEFVVVSTDGYIRTYFNPSDGIDYFNRQ